MQMIKNTKIGIKILLLITIAFLSLIVVGLTGLSTMNKMSQSSTSMYQDTLLPVKWLNQLRSNSNESAANVLSLIFTTDASMKQTILKKIDVTTEQTNKIMADYKVSNLSPFEVENLKKLDTMTQKLRDERKKTIDLAVLNKKDEAYAVYTQSYSPLIQERFNIIQDLANYNEQQADDLNNENIQHYTSVRTTSILILIISLLACVATGYVITRLVTRPIGAMQNLMEKAESGDLTVFGNYKSKDEVGSLTQSFNAMIEGLRNLMKQINENSLSLSATSEELSASAEQAGHAAGQITESIQEVSTGADKLLGNVQTTEQTIEQMSLKIQQISTNTQLVSEKAMHASESAIDGKQAIEQSVRQMNSIQSSVGNAARSIAELGEQAQHIGKIVETISGIANQTNLLALNAAIEAARVGEQGKGFTVVSNEIRKLAEQSSQSANQIAGYIESVQKIINTAVDNMEVGTKEVADGTVVVSAVSDSFDQIYNAVNEVTKQIQEISGTVQEIAVGTEEVVKSFDAVSNIASVSAAETQTVSAATEEQLASTEEIAASASSLSNMADELQSLVSTFKI